ncbi:MAG: hypothetical protein AAEJ04_10665 [Planctomycetota bacterium]
MGITFGCFRSILKTEQNSRATRWLTTGFPISLLTISLCLAGCSISSDVQQQLNTKVSLAGSRASVDGSVTTSAAGLASKMDFDQFGASDSNLTLGARVQLDHGPLRFIIDRVESSNSGTDFYDGFFGGANLPPDQYRLETELASTRLLMAFPLLSPSPEKSLPLDLRLLAGFNLAEIRVALQSIATPTTFSELDELAPIPVIGFESNLSIATAWNLEGTFTILPLSEITEYDAQCVDNSLRLLWSPSSQWEAFIGARNHSLELDGLQAGNPTEIDLQLKLIEIGISHRF